MLGELGVRPDLRFHYTINSLPGSMAGDFQYKCLMNGLYKVLALKRKLMLALKLALTSIICLTSNKSWKAALWSDPQGLDQRVELV